jgi:radical SAM superfamily enzyme YgiQ (UPF0313 family)
LAREKAAFRRDVDQSDIQALKVKTSVNEFFELCDAIVIGEGETAIYEIMAGGGCFDGTQTFMNTMLYDRNRDQLVFPPIRYESVPLMGTPIYDHPWELYLSPASGINYAPTRGCYWNRCTFCDYGLNTDKPHLLGVSERLSNA